MKPNEFERRRALINALCEILWKVGDKRRCCVCLLQQERCFQQDYRLRDDSITEKVCIENVIIRNAIHRWYSVNRLIFAGFYFRKNSLI